MSNGSKSLGNVSLSLDFGDFAGNIEVQITQGNKATFDDNMKTTMFRITSVSPEQRSNDKFVVDCPDFQIL